VRETREKPRCGCSGVEEGLLVVSALATEVESPLSVEQIRAVDDIVEEAEAKLHERS